MRLNRSGSERVGDLGCGARQGELSKMWGFLRVVWS